MMLASQLTSRVDIEEPTTTNTKGVSSSSWTVIARSVPAEVVPRESMTVKQAAGVQAQTTHLVTIRIRTDITSKCRLKLGSRTLNILGPPRRVPEARPEKMILECIEVE